MNTAPPRLAWLSPLAPRPTDIAHYTARLLPALLEGFSVDLWAPQEGWELGEMTDHPGVQVSRFDPEDAPMRALNRATASIYNIGNNAAFHGAIMGLARARPGIVILHDTRLQHLVWEALAAPDYRQAMFDSYGFAGAAAAEQLIAAETTPEELAEHYPLTGHAIGTALAVVVHSETAANAVRALADSDGTAPPVVVLPLPYPAGPPPADRAPAARDGLRRLIQFGYIGPNRRLSAILQALAGHPDKARFRLDIYGRIWGKSALEREIRQLGLGGQVQIHGFVPEAELDAAIAAADLAFNLRWPSMGETSGSQLRLWKLGTPALVTRTGWYAELPAECISAIDPAQEISEIQRHLSRLLTEPAAYRAQAAAGRKRLETLHDPRQYAAGLATLLPHLPALQQRAAVVALGRHLGARLKREDILHPGMGRLGAVLAEFLPPACREGAA